jgi:uncharacterized membrane protein
MSDPVADPADAQYSAVLRPYRSLPPKGFTWLMLSLAGVSFCVSLFFVLHGAWR